MIKMQKIAGFLENKSKYFHKETLTDGTSVPVKIPNVGRPVGVSVSPGTGATIQYTFSNYVDIQEGNAIWFDWPKGEVAEPENDTAESVVTALRLISTGTSVWEISV